MENKLNVEKIKVLLNSAQEQRLHWSQMVTTLMGFEIVLNGGIWTYALIDYIKGAGSIPMLVLIPSAISAVTLGFWRIYTRYLDKQIAAFYPELVLYEGILSAPNDTGISGYLMRNVPNLRDLLTCDLSVDEKSHALRILVESNHIGNRGHSAIEYAVLAFISFSFVGSLAAIWWVRDSIQLPNAILYAICLVAIVLGIVLVISALFAFHRDPSISLVKSTLEKVKKS